MYTRTDIHIASKLDSSLILDIGFMIVYIIVFVICTWYKHNSNI